MIEVLEETLAPKEAQKSKNKEKSTNYTYTKKMLDRNEIFIHTVFSFILTTKITNDFELKIVDERKQKHD